MSQLAPRSPVFCAEFTRTTVTATATVTIAGTPFSLSVGIPDDCYWMGMVSTSRNLATRLIASLNTDTSGTWSYKTGNIVIATGVSGTIQRAGNSTVVWSSLNSVMVDLLASVGYQTTTSGFSMSLDGTDRVVTLNRYPAHTWWPNGPNLDTDRYLPVRRYGTTSELPSSGSLIASSQQDDGVRRWWRTWRMTQIAAARVSQPRMNSAYDTQWKALTGITQTNPQQACLDVEDGWWDRTVLGQYRFVGFEDHLQLGTSGTAYWDVYQIVYDDDCPVSMEGWKALREPNVRTITPAAALQAVEFGALAFRVGNT